MTTLFEIETTYIGADASTKLYFDTKEKAQAYLDTLENGELREVILESDYPPNYFDGCTLNDLTFGHFDADFIN